MKNGSFCEELLSENDFEAVLANFCCYDYGANAHKNTGVACQLIKTANFIATPTYEKIYLTFCYVLAGDTSQVSIFFLT